MGRPAHDDGWWPRWCTCGVLVSYLGCGETVRRARRTLDLETSRRHQPPGGSMPGLCSSRARCVWPPHLKARTGHACEEEKGAWINASYHHERGCHRESIPMSSFLSVEAQPPDATLRVRTTSIAVGIGYSWGEGIVTFQGQEYPCRSMGSPSVRWASAAPMRSATSTT